MLDFTNSASRWKLLHFTTKSSILNLLDFSHKLLHLHSFLKIFWISSVYKASSSKLLYSITSIESLVQFAHKMFNNFKRKFCWILLTNYFPVKSSGALFKNWENPVHFFERKFCLNLLTKQSTKKFAWFSSENIPSKILLDFTHKRKLLDFTSEISVEIFCWKFVYEYTSDSI